MNQSLANYERISTVVINKETWTEHNNLLTPTLKVKRNKIDETFMNDYLVWHNSKEQIIFEK